MGGVEKEADSGGEKGEVPVDASQREPVGSVKAEVEEDGKEKGKEGKKEKEKEGMSDEEKKVEGELNAILKRSPSEFKVFLLCDLLRYMADCVISVNLC